jgi:ribosomal protein S18 acetylase RimI-like enzyme
MTVTIRQYREGDRAAVYEVCVRTGAAGQDARGRYSTDDLIPDIFVGPFLVLEPEHAYVLDDGGRAVGYIIGTADTEGFVAAYREHWLPRLRDKYPEPAASPVTLEEQKLHSMYHPEYILRPELVPHPAHLHINLLPEYQGAGHGRALMNMFLGSVAAAGAKSCYLAVRSTNTAALGFYDRLGWRPVQVPDAGDAIYLARPTRDA